MAQVAGPLAAVSSLASAGLGAYGSVQEGKGKQAAYDYESANAELKAQRAERAAEFGRLQANLTDTGMREDLVKTLGNIDAIRASANVDPTSPTSFAITDAQRDTAERARRAAVLTQTTQAKEDVYSAAQDRATAGYLRQAGKFAYNQAKIGAIGQLAGGLSKAAAGYR